MKLPLTNIVTPEGKIIFINLEKGQEAKRLSELAQVSNLAKSNAVALMELHKRRKPFTYFERIKVATKLLKTAFKSNFILALKILFGKESVEERLALRTPIKLYIVKNKLGVAMSEDSSQ